MLGECRYGGSWLEGSGAVYAENQVLARLASEFGMPATAGGVFVQGGTLGNLSALVAARDHARAERARAERAQAERTEADGPAEAHGPAETHRPAAPAPHRRWKIVCSAEAHSSIASAAGVMDVDVVPVAPDASGVLRGAQVRAALEEHGDDVFAVVATAGSTNFGIVDDIASIAALKADHDFWLHVDGAYGLAGMLSPEARHHFAGVETPTPAIVDPHKWLFAPFDACALLYREPELALVPTPSTPSTWRRHRDGRVGVPSDDAAHLTRRARGLPLGFSPASHGGRCTGRGHGLHPPAERIAREIESRPGFRLVRPPQLSVVVFERDGWSREDYAIWSVRLLEEQHAFVTPSSHDGRPNTRFAIVNPNTTFEHLTGILDTM